MAIEPLKLKKKLTGTRKTNTGKLAYPTLTLNSAVPYGKFKGLSFNTVLKKHFKTKDEREYFHWLIGTFKNKIDFSKLSYNPIPKSPFCLLTTAHTHWV